VPDTWAPTWTVTMGLTVPVAVTFARIGPRSAVAVSNRNAGTFLAVAFSRTRNASAATTTSPTTATTLFQGLLVARWEPLRGGLTLTVAVVIVTGRYAAAVP